jgi:hypothetical protein
MLIALCGRTHRASKCALLSHLKITGEDCAAFSINSLTTLQMGV